MSQTARYILYLLLINLMLAAGSYSAKAQSQVANPNGPPASQQSLQQPVQTYRLSQEKLEKAIGYSRIRNIFHFAGVGYSVLLLIIVLVAKVGPKYRSLAERTSNRRFVQVIIFVPLLLFTIDVLTLPLDAWRQTFALKYDQSIQSWPSWFQDWAIGEAISLAVATLMIWLLYFVIRRSPRRWWFYFWLIALPFMVAAIFVTPVVVDPLFNKFVPLERTQPDLVSKIEEVTKHGGLDIPRDHIFEMAASEKTQTVNAYVTGIGSTKRIVMWDTTVQRMTTPQVLFVVGHEMGHYVLGHIQKGLAFIAVVSLILIFIGYHALHWILRRWGNRLDVRDVTDWASLPVMMVIVLIFGFFTEPVFNTFGRYVEHQADIYGLEVTHGITPDANQVAAQSFQILGETYLEEPDPNPFIKVWRFNHPPINERLSFAAQYDPWSKGESPQFIK